MTSNDYARLILEMLPSAYNKDDGSVVSQRAETYSQRYERVYAALDALLSEMCPQTAAGQLDAWEEVVGIVPPNNPYLYRFWWKGEDVRRRAVINEYFRKSLTPTRDEIIQEAMLAAETSVTPSFSEWKRAAQPSNLKYLVFRFSLQFNTGTFEQWQIERMVRRLLDIKPAHTFFSIYANGTTVYP